MSEIKNRHTWEIICSGECSVKELAETNKANLSEANLSGADLRGAKLHGANLIEADLRGANLCGAKLIGADLRGANLYGANLIEADLRGAKYGEEDLLKYLRIGQIGSRNDCLQVFITNENIYLRTGCWSGSPMELLERTDREDYRESVDYILTVAKRVRREVQG